MYDELTDKRIKSEITIFNQKRIERTLKALKILNEEGNEDTKLMLLYIQMRVLKKINYGNLAENVEQLFQDDTINTYDSVDTYDEKAVLNVDPNSSGDDKYKDRDDDDIGNDFGRVISRDDDDGEQDYDTLAVDDD